MKHKRRNFVVIGLGTFGSTVATELVRYGNHVMGIGIDERKVSRLADTLAEAVIADARDEEALRQAGVGNYDVAVVAIGEDIEANILCTMNLKVLEVPCIWVKATTPTHHRILSRLGADRIIQPEQEIGQHVAQMLHNPLVRDYVNLGNDVHVVDFQVPEQLDGRMISKLKLDERFEIRCLGLMRNRLFVDCQLDDSALKTGDDLLLLGGRENLRSFTDSL